LGQAVDLPSVQPVSEHLARDGLCADDEVVIDLGPEAAPNRSIP
jgi:hypothetical protein